MGGAWDPREKENGRLEHQTTLHQNKEALMILRNNGCGFKFFRPESLMDGDKFIDIDDPDYYFTDAMSDRACEMITNR